MRNYTAKEPTENACQAVASILEEFWGVVLIDFASQFEVAQT